MRDEREDDLSLDEALSAGEARDVEIVPGVFRTCSHSW